MTVLILRHTPGNTLGVLEPLLSDHGLPWRYVDVFALPPQDLPALQTGLSGLIILGGRDSVRNEDRHASMPMEQQLIRQAVGAGLPVFGICLGGQLLARALGGTVKRNPVKERGWIPLTLSPEGWSDPVLSVLEGESQFQWHEDTFICPPGATHLAASETCPRQAFRVSEKVYGLQFHPEVTRETIALWLAESKRLPGTQKQHIREETEATFNRRAALSRKMFACYLKQAY